MTFQGIWKRERRKGAKLPPNTLYTGKPSMWANPFNWQDVMRDNPELRPETAKLLAVGDFKAWLEGRYFDWYQQDLRWRILGNLGRLKEYDWWACWDGIWRPGDPPIACHNMVYVELIYPELLEDEE